MKIDLLIVDDEKIIRDTISDYFEDYGWSVINFGSGEEALNFLKDNTAVYVIVDGRLPGMTGTDFIHRAIEIKSGMKYIIYTGAVDFTISDELRAAGVTEKNILMKPAMGFSVLQKALEDIN